MSSSGPERPAVGTAAVIFDMDGVLVLSSTLHVQVWGEYFERIGHDPGPDGPRAVLGRRGVDVLAELHPDRSAMERRRIVRELEARTDELQATSPPPLAAGAQQLVADVAAGGARLGLATSAYRDAVDLLLGDLVDHFDVVVTAADVERGKPDPAIYLAAAGHLGVGPARCTVVEDAPAGVRAARAAGMRVVAVEGTAPPARLLDAGAERVVARLDELRAEDLCQNVI